MVEIRPFRTEDAAAVRALFVRVNRLLAPPALAAAFEAYIARSLAEEIEDVATYYGARHGGFWVAIEDARLAGMFGLEPAGDDAMELRRMYVDPDLQRRGIARRLLAYAEDEIGRRGMARMVLSTSELQGAALALYRTSGYRMVREEIAEAASNKTLGGGIRRYHFEKLLQRTGSAVSPGSILWNSDRQPGRHLPGKRPVPQKRLIVMAGLPGSGKSALAERLASVLHSPILSVDPIEAAMRRSGIPKAMTGIAAYAIAEAVAEENLKLGVTVVVDAVNPVEAARAAWVRLAALQSVPLTFVECWCADLAVHRNRIEARVRGIAGMPEVTWDRVEERRAEYEPWSMDRIVLDTSKEEPDRLVQRVLAMLAET